MAFVAIEVFSGTVKTTLAIGLEKHGWTRRPEVAQTVPRVVPATERAETCANCSFLVATMVNSSMMSESKNGRRIVQRKKSVV